MGFMKILDRVSIGHGEDFHPGGLCTVNTRDRILDNQAGSGGDGLTMALSIQRFEGLEKWLRVKMLQKRK